MGGKARIRWQRHGAAAVGWRERRRAICRTCLQRLAPKPSFCAPPPVSQSADATIGTIKALEARQDRQRSQLDGVAATATLADTKCATLQAEVARLQRRVHGGGSPLGGSDSPRRSPFRLY